MSDAKTDYSDAVKAQKDASTRDSIIADLIQQGYARKATYGAEWDTVDINDVVSVVAPGAKPVIEGGKIIYYNKERTRAVVADVSGYLRVQDLSKKTKKRQYLDMYGRNAHNVTGANGKKRGRTKDEFQRATHYIIRKRNGGV
uniref:hypothetical protein n=1 Tax=Eubacterium cellulosolvens TaxID=29322 RepID=UPI0004839070|nr:hypothetical protein [[Eubacterium] cellulosolvens]